MAEKEFLLSDFAKHVKTIYDCMTAATASKDAKPTMDRKAARDAAKALYDMLSPDDEQDDPTLGKQESAKGDKARAADRRTVRVASDRRTAGAGSPFAGVDYEPGHASDHSIDSIFHGQSEAGEPVDASLDSIFRRETLGEG